MKRMIFLAAMAMACICVKAQTINESVLIGYWQPADDEEIPPYYDVPTCIWFKDNGTCEYTTQEGTLYCEGFTLGHDGNYLHLFSRNNYAGNTEFTMINLRLGRANHPGDYKVYLYFNSYDGKSWKIKMVNNISPSSVRSITADPARGTKKYDLQGVATDNPKGVYIQDGKKIAGRND